MSFISLFATAQSYDSLWKREQNLEKEGKPQSAYAIAQQILTKAEAEGRLGQALSARLCSASLQQEWAPDSFFTAVAELETLRQRADQPEVKAIYASVLAELYQQSRSRSQARDLELTSADMKEWTREQYDNAAIRNWQLSLADVEALAGARSGDWLPFVAQSSHSSYFHHDLLHILWQRVRDQRHRIWDVPEMNIRKYWQAVVDCYHRHGNREAEFLVRLDGLELTDETDTFELQALISDFADLPLCTEAYLRLLQTDATAAQKVTWAEEALRRYPRYDRIGEVRNQLNELRRPIVTWTGNDVYYPGKEYIWKLTGKNATSMEISIYRMRDDFDELKMNLGKQTASQYFRRNGSLVQTLHPVIPSGLPYETVEDSVRWTAPDAGCYAILYTAGTDEREAVRHTVTNQYGIFRVTPLMTLQRSMPDGSLEVIVVDAESGQPVQDATVTLFRQNNRTGERQQLEQKVSNAEGRTRFRSVERERGRFSVQAAKGADHWLPACYAFNNTPRATEEQTSMNLRLYTDRAIYRPGQTVHLGGIAYTQQHWDAKPLASQEYELILRDANWKEVERQKVTTDEMGVFSTDFVLPEGRLLGNYRIQSGSATVFFRVEEYKRPTFEVKMDEAPALQWPQDSIILTGKAMGYNGVPIRGGRVTGKYQFTYPYFWWYRHEDSPRLSVDTVETDEMGVFSVHIPLKEIPAEALKYGLYLALDVEVLSAAGETREGSTRVPLCTTPLRLTINMNEKQDRDRLKIPTFTLLTSTGKPADADIHCFIYRIPETGVTSQEASSSSQSRITPSSSSETTPTISEKIALEPVLSDISPSGLLDALCSLPSGQYELRASAQSADATASDSARFYLFSMTDTHLPRHADSWLYCPVDTFDLQHPARIQVGSSFTDVALYYCLTSAKGIVKDELIPLSNELRLLEIPYKEDYGDGLTASFAFVKHGQPYQLTQTLRLTRPDTQLRWQWTSFRDRLHPGDKEEWTLRLLKPDGTPATANLMAVIYDASLDQLAPHHWALALSQYHRLMFCNWNAQNWFAQGNAHQQLFFPVKDYRVKGLTFDRVDGMWLNGLNFFAGTRMMVGSARPMMMMKASRNSVVTLEEAAFDGGAVQVTSAPAKAALTADKATGTIYEEDAEAESANEKETVAPASVAVRTNFNETAAFMPRLHSNPETGEVTLSFTLPESLTTWQMLGLAHTQDMMTANVQAQAIARKEMMARLYLPRFLRAGDQSSIRAVVQNLTDKSLSGKANLEIFDPETNKLIKRQQANFMANANGEAVLSFDYAPAEEPSIVAVRLTAESASFSDGEQQYLPILSSKQWMTESVEVQADSAGTFTTDLSTLFNKNARTATRRRLTVEYTTHPIWNVVQALPALREPQTDDVLSLTSIFYANALAAQIAATTPRLQTIIELWKKEADKPAASTSPLARNEELKQLILDETPWLREADNDTQRRAQLIDLFNENLVDSRLNSALERISQRQQADGGFGWFPGMNSSELMTRLVCLELTRLRSLTSDFKALPGTAKQKANTLLQNAFKFIAQENSRLIEEMKKAEAKGATIQTGHLMHLHFVYIAQRVGVKLTRAQHADVRYLLDHLKGTVAGMSNDERAVAAVVLKTDGKSEEAQLYYDSMKEHMTTTPQRGTFFDYAGGSFTPTGHKVIIHTAAMEAVATMEPRTSQTASSSLMCGLRRWLLQQKRTQMWESSICTIDAIYALLHDNTVALEETEKDVLTLNYGKRKVRVSSDVASPAALGYVRATYADGAAPKSITVQRHTPTEAWGAVYAQYLTPIADATAHAAGLTIRRELSNSAPRLGDKLTTRYVITADRDYEYVCLRAARAACAEPSEQLSGYRYQGGLGYYRAVRDAHTDYFFDRLPKGIYVLEETAFIDRTGRYTTGLVTLQCHYAPEFGANTPAVELVVKGE